MTIAAFLTTILLPYLATWITSKGLLLMLAQPWAQKALGLALQSAKVPAVAIDKLLVGPLRFISRPIICLLVLAGFWLMTLVDKLLEGKDADTRMLVEGLQNSLAAMGSTDRKLYLQAKTMTAEQVKAVSLMAEAVAAPAEELSYSHLAALRMAREAGEALQAARLHSEG